MDITLLTNNDKLCGLYMEGILVDPDNVDSVVSDNGLNVKHVLFTKGVEAESELPSLGEISVERFSVGCKGDKKFGLRFKTPDGDVVYAPSFDRVEKAKISNCALAILDPGDRTEITNVSGLAHKSFGARQRMTNNSGVQSAIWVDEIKETEVLSLSGQVIKRKESDLPKEKTDTKSKEESMDMITMHVRDAFNVKFNMPPATVFTSGGIEAVIPPAFVVREVFDGYLIACSYNDYDKCWRVNYSDGYVFDEYSDWKEVTQIITYEPVEKTQFIVEKSGEKYYWTSISSSDFKDLDGEVVATSAMDFAIAINKKRQSYGNLVWEHYDELPVGVCTAQKRVGRFLVENGEFFDTPFARKAASKMEEATPGKYRISIGFKYWKGTRSDDGTYHLIDIFHRAVTIRPANPFTGIEVNKSMKELTEDTKKAIMADLGVTEDELKEVLASVKTEEKSLNSEVALKEETPEVVKTQVGVVPEVTTEEKPDEIADLKTQVSELKSLLEDTVKSLKTNIELTREELVKSLADAPKGDITRPSQAAPELTEDEKKILKTEVEESQKEVKDNSMVSKSFYDMFTSKRGDL